ncbi:MAG: TolC family protein [Gammaproteobacteria bacterium]
MCGKKALWLLLALLLSAVSATAMADVLTLRQAETLALANAKELIALQNEQQAQEKKTAINNHLQSPSFQLGGEYPKDVLPSSPAEETTTMVLGVKQPLPQLRTRTLQSLTSTYLTQAHAAQISQIKALILRETRENWLNLYESLQTQRILGKQLAGSPPGNRPELQNQIAQAHQQESILREHLKQQIGKTAIMASLPDSLPSWPDLPDQKILEAQLLENPKLQADSRLVSASQQSVKLAAEQRNSGLNLSVGYGFEQNNSPTLSNNPNSATNSAANDKANLITLRLTIPLSSSSNPSQDEEVKKHVQQLETHQQQQRQDFLAIKKLLTEAYQDWQQSNKEVAVCKSQEGALATTLDCLHASVNRAKAQAQVYYLLGK